MKWKCIFFILLGAIITCKAYAEEQQMPWPKANTQPSRVTGSTKEGLNSVKQAGTSYLNDQLKQKLSAWFTRTDINYAIQEDHKPVASAETIQPFYMDDWHTVFWQGRLAYNDSATTGNVGLGYRYLMDNKKLMWGVNTFYDQNISHSHKRVGVGGEAFTPYLTFRANYYEAISGNREVGGYMERALDGYDGGVEAPIPYIPWMRLKAEGYHWNGVDTSDVNGEIATLRTFPTKQLEIDLGVAHDNSLGRQAFLELDYYLGRPAFIQYSATTSHLVAGFAPLNLEDLRLQKVLRHNDIVVEKTSGSASGGIIIARGT